MNIPIIIFITTIVVFVPLAGALLYVWWKYGKNEKGIAIARLVFVTGTVFLFGYMFTM